MIDMSCVLCYRVLLRSSEAPEDDYQQGIDDLKQVLNFINECVCNHYNVLIMCKILHYILVVEFLIL